MQRLILLLQSQENDMGKFITIQKGQIEEALKDISRQYCVGKLKKKQKIEHINHRGLEIGLTEYKEYTTENPHFHNTAMECELHMTKVTRIRQRSFKCKLM